VQTREVAQCLKLITRPGCERIIRYALEFARVEGRRKVTCMTKNNIMKITDGLFASVFEELAAEYPELEMEHRIIDIGAAKLAADPEPFDVIVTPNLYGDILSDIAAEVAGSVGLVGSANIGTQASMFEAIHGSAPDIAGQKVANPSALLRATCMMLSHVGQGSIAARIEAAWLQTLQDGVHTVDSTGAQHTTRQVGTQEFADAVIERFESLELPSGSRLDDEVLPVELPAASKSPAHPEKQAKRLVGVDIFLDWDEAGRDPEVLGLCLQAALSEVWILKMISNRGTKVFPNGHPVTTCTDHWRCRFLPKDGGSLLPREILLLQGQLMAQGFEIIKTENLYQIGGKAAYSLGQGE